MDNITLIRSQMVTPTETHFEIEINGKVVQFAKWVDNDWITDWEYLNGNDWKQLTEEEEELVIDFIDEQVI